MNGPPDWSSDLNAAADAAALRDAIAQDTALRGKAADGMSAIIHVGGSEAVPFLHAQFSSDVAALAPGQCRLSAWCSPKGRVLFLLRVIRTDEACLLILPATQREAFARRLGMFVLRADVAISDLSDSHGILRCSGADASANDAALASDGDQSWFVGETAQLCDAWPTIDLPVIGPHGIRLAAIRRGEAQLAPDLSDKFLPQELNLDLLGGVSFEKGCYPGQEIIARVRYRGEVKRRLRRFLAATADTVDAGTRLLDSAGNNTGTVISSISADGMNELLAVVDTGAEAVRLAIAPDVTIEQRALPDCTGA